MSSGGLAEHYPMQTGEGRFQLNMVPPELDEIIEAVLTTSRVFVAIAARSIEELDSEVTLPQFRLLIVLATHGTQSLGRLAEHLAVNSSTATRMSDRLIRKGLMQRRASSLDCREIRVDLTQGGQQLVERAMESRRRELARLLNSISASEQRALVRSLSALNLAMDAVPAASWASGWL